MEPEKIKITLMIMVVAMMGSVLSVVRDRKVTIIDALIKIATGGFLAGLAGAAIQEWFHLNDKPFLVFFFSFVIGLVGYQIADLLIKFVTKKETLEELVEGVKNLKQ